MQGKYALAKSMKIWFLTWDLFHCKYCVERHSNMECMELSLTHLLVSTVALHVFTRTQLHFLSHPFLLQFIPFIPRYFWSAAWCNPGATSTNKKTVFFMEYVLMWSGIVHLHLQQCVFFPSFIIISCQCCLLDCIQHYGTKQTKSAHARPKIGFDILFPCQYFINGCCYMTSRSPNRVLLDRQ